MKLTGARSFLECLKREGVDVLFGLPGGAVLPIYDALYDFAGLRHILVRQEAAAGHAADRGAVGAAAARGRALHAGDRAGPEAGVVRGLRDHGALVPRRAWDVERTGGAA